MSDVSRVLDDYKRSKGGITEQVRLLNPLTRIPHSDSYWEQTNGAGEPEGVTASGGDIGRFMAVGYRDPAASAPGPVVRATTMEEATAIVHPKGLPA